MSREEGERTVLVQDTSECTVELSLIQYLYLNFGLVQDTSECTIELGLIHYLYPSFGLIAWPAYQRGLWVECVTWNQGYVKH